MTRRYLNTARFALVGVCLAITMANCGPGGLLEVGPVRVTSSMGSGSFVPAVFGKAATVTVDQDFCDMPSESELSDQVLEVGGVDFSKFVRLSRLDLVHGTLTATEGNFDFMTDLTVSFVPAEGVEGSTEPVVLGTASDAGGLGTEITLVPPDGVDILALIRQNDNNEAGTCPKLRYEMTIKSAPLMNVKYDISLTVDAYAQVGKF